MKRLTIILLCLGAVVARADEKLPTQSLKLSLKNAEQMFLEQNLELIARRYDIEIAQAQVLQSKLFDNPVISLEQNIYNRLNRKYFDVGKQGESGIEIEQVINLAGQRNKRVRLERINKEIAQYQFEEVLRTLRSEVNEKFVEIYFLSRSLSVYVKEIESLDKLLKSMKEQQEKGNISLMENSRLETLLLSLKKEKTDMENDLVKQRGELSLLLNLPVEQDIELLFDDTVLKQLNLSMLPFPEMNEMLSSRPDLKIARAGINASQANLKLQRSMAAPEFSVKGIYDRAGNFINNYFAVGISLSIPVFNRNQGNIKSAKFEIQKSNTEEKYAIQKARTELYSAFNQLQKSVELYHSTNEELEQNFEILIAGFNENYRKRNISMLEFIDYYSSYKETYLQLYETRKNVFLAMENLNMIIGQNIFNY